MRKLPWVLYCDIMLAVLYFMYFQPYEFAVYVFVKYFEPFVFCKLFNNFKPYIMLYKKTHYYLIWFSGNADNDCTVLILPILQFLGTQLRPISHLKWNAPIGWWFKSSRPVTTIASITACVDAQVCGQLSFVEQTFIDYLTTNRNFTSRFVSSSFHCK